MSDQDKPKDGSLVPTGRHDLAPVAGANPLVLRALADLAQVSLSNVAEVLPVDSSEKPISEAGLQKLKQMEQEIEELMTKAATRRDRLTKSIEETDRRNAENALFFYTRGTERLENGDCEKAVEDFNEALRLSPNLTDAYCGRADAWLGRKDYDKAIADYTEVIRLDGAIANTYKNLDNACAGCYYKRGRAWHGREDYDRAIKDYEQAIEDFDEDIRLDPKLTDDFDRDEYDRLKKRTMIVILGLTYLQRGVAWHKKGNYDKAIQDFDQAIRLMPNAASAYNYRGRAWYGKKDYDQAIKDFNEAIRLDPNDASAYNRAIDLRKRRLEKLRSLHTPEVILQNELRMINELEDGRRNARKALAE